MRIEINEGHRPSLLMLGRYATGELNAEERASVEARMGPEGAATLSAMEAAKRRVSAFDPVALRARAGGAASTPKPANRGWPIGLWLLAAALVLAVLVPVAEGPADTVTMRGGGLVVQVADRGALRAWAGEPLGEGDVVALSVRGDAGAGVVLLSIDGRNTWGVHWPSEGSSPEPLDGAAQMALPGTLILDDAPGAEVFVAIYDADVPSARRAAEARWQRGGVEALRAWADADPRVDVLVVPKRGAP